METPTETQTQKPRKAERKGNRKTQERRTQREEGEGHTWVRGTEAAGQGWERLPSGKGPR